MLMAASPLLQVRLKRILEMRGADSGPRPLIHALPTLWVGLLYDAQVTSPTACCKLPVGTA